MGVTFWILTGALVIGGSALVALLLRTAAGRRPAGSTETILQVDAENRAVFGRTDHEEWDGEVRIVRPTDPRIVRQIRDLRKRRGTD